MPSVPEDLAPPAYGRAPPKVRNQRERSAGFVFEEPVFSI
jgi:hypothetical protein